MDLKNTWALKWVYPCQTVVELFQMRHISVIVVSPWRNGDPDQGLMSHSSDVIFPILQTLEVFFSQATTTTSCPISIFECHCFQIGKFLERLDMESKRFSA